jgi:hypothetical protein
MDNFLGLPDDQRRLLRRYYETFYLPLAKGKWFPRSEAQHHFVAVCLGKSAPVTVHEFAYLNFKKYCALTGLTEEEGVARDFAFTVPAPRQLASVHPMEQRSSDYSGAACPRCARKGIRSLLVWRHARDPNAPGEFLGCSRYPQCRYTEQ